MGNLLVIFIVFKVKGVKLVGKVKVAFIMFVYFNKLRLEMFVSLNSFCKFLCLL